MSATGTDSMKLLPSVATVPASVNPMNMLSAPRVMPANSLPTIGASFRILVDPAACTPRRILSMVP